MKTLLMLATVGLLSSSAYAKKTRAPAPAKKPVVTETTKQMEATLKELDYGETFVLGSRRSTQPTDAVTTVDAAKAVSDAQVSMVIKERQQELEYCWLRLPASKRVASSATLKLAIEASGTVAGIEVEGELPAGVAKCMTTLATKWTFPAADAGCEVEHAFAMGTKSDVVR